jgi:hypothetical protein
MSTCECGNRYTIHLRTGLSLTLFAARVRPPASKTSSASVSRLTAGTANSISCAALLRSVSWWGSAPVRRITAAVSIPKWRTANWTGWRYCPSVPVNTGGVRAVPNKVPLTSASCVPAGASKRMQSYSAQLPERVVMAISFTPVLSQPGSNARVCTRATPSLALPWIV